MTNTTTTATTNERGIVTTKIAAEHGITDSKGRSVGGYVVVWQSPTDGVFYAKSYATRNGAQFGAAFPKSTRAGTILEQAITHAHAKLEAQGRRYAKLAAAGRL